MRALKMLTVVMGVLIVLGTVTLVVLVLQRAGGGARVAVPAGVSVAQLLDEPAGTSIAGIALAQDRLAVHLHGGGPDRVLLLDPHTGAISLRVGLAR
jgi:Family of unknown function (DUF6476)